MGSECDVSTRPLHVIGGITLSFIGLARMLSPLNEPLIFRTLEVKIIQSKRWRSPSRRHAHILTRHAHARNSAYQYEICSKQKSQCSIHLTT